jgi:hypothetical protein
MKRFVEGEDRTQGVLLPEFLDDYVAEDNPVRVVDVFIDELDLEGLGFSGVAPEVKPRSGGKSSWRRSFLGFLARLLQRQAAHNPQPFSGLAENLILSVWSTTSSSLRQRRRETSWRSNGHRERRCRSRSRL